MATFKIKKEITTVGEGIEIINYKLFNILEAIGENDEVIKIKQDVGYITIKQLENENIEIQKQVDSSKDFIRENLKKIEVINSLN